MSVQLLRMGRCVALKGKAFGMKLDFESSNDTA